MSVLQCVVFKIVRIICFLMRFMSRVSLSLVFLFQAEDGIRDLVRSRGLGDVYKRQPPAYAAQLHC